MKKYPLCLGNIPKDFTIDNMKKKTGLRINVRFFDDYRSVNINEILGIHKYLMNCYKIMFEIIKQCQIQPTLINLHPNEYDQELHYHPFAVKLDKCVGSCNTLNDLSNKVYVPKKQNI